MTEEQILSHIESKMPFTAKPHLDSNLYDELGFDSGLLLDLIVGIEERCGCELPDEALSMEALKTPRRILELVNDLLRHKQSTHRDV